MNAARSVTQIHALSVDHPLRFSFPLFFVSEFESWQTEAAKSRQAERQADCLRACLMNVHVVRQALDEFLDEPLAPRVLHCVRASFGSLCTCPMHLFSLPLFTSFF